MLLRASGNTCGTKRTTLGARSNSTMSRTSWHLNTYTVLLVLPDNRPTQPPSWRKRRASGRPPVVQATVRTKSVARIWTPPRSPSYSAD